MFGTSKKQPRLGQWTGRRRSSRSDEPMLPHLWRRDVLLRLAVVLLTTAAVTCLAYWGGPPLPYRVGETYPFDLRVRVDFELVNHLELVNQNQPVQVADAGAARQAPFQEAARWTERPVVDRYPQGMLLVQRGQPISER